MYLFSSRITTFVLSLLVTTLFSTTSVCGDGYDLYYMCDEKEGSINYQTYVDMISGTISTQAALYGYGFRIVKEVHGALLCRGDVGPDICETCFIRARLALRDLCPARLQALWYSDYCYLSHTYEEAAWDPYIYYCSAGNIAVLLRFSEVLWTVFNQVAINAPGDAKYLSALYMDLGNSNILYGYGQCHNQIAAEYCRQCLEWLRDWVVGGDTCTKGFAGGRLVAGSCIIRYELYPFLDG